MLIVMKAQAGLADIGRGCERIESLGFNSHIIPGEQRTAIGITGNSGPIDPAEFEDRPGVAEAIRVQFSGPGRNRVTLFGGRTRRNRSRHRYRSHGHRNVRPGRRIRGSHQIGARNMQNFSLLRRAGRSRKPILLKRGMSSTLEEFLMAAEYTPRRTKC